VGSARVTVEQDGVVRANGTTDAAGAYRIFLFNVSDSSFDVSAVSGEQGAWKLGVTVPLGTQQVDLALQSAVSISGSTLALDNSPLQNVLVQVVEAIGSISQNPARRDGPALPSDRVVTDAITDDKGAFKFINLKPGSYRVRCHVPGKQICYKDGELLLVEGLPLEKVDFRLAPFKKGTWQNFSYIDDLAGDYVNDIYCASDGAIWFATDGGVSRYDGMEFFNLTKQEGLAHDWVDSIAASPDGTLLFATSKGLSAWDGQSFVKSKLVETMGSRYARPIYRDPEGPLWLGDWNAGGLWRYDGKEVTPVTGMTNIVTCFRRDSKGKMWIGTQQGLFTFDGTNAIRHPISEMRLSQPRRRHGDRPSISSLRYASIGRVGEDSHGTIWFTTSGARLFRYDGKECRLLSEEDGFPSGPYPIYCDSRGNFWFGNWPGSDMVLTRFDGTSFVNYVLEFGSKDTSIYDMPFIHRDMNGVLWLGANKGVWRYDESTFQNYTAADGLPTTAVTRTLATPEGTVWFGGYRGASRFDGTNFANLTPEQLRGQTNLPLDRRYTYVNAIHLADDGAIWFGVQYSGAVRWDGTNFTRYFTNGVGRFDRAPDGKLWFTQRTGSGSSGVSSVVNYDGKSFNRFGLKAVAVTNFLTTVHCDAEGKVWFGSSGEGLIRYDGTNFTRLSTEQGLVDANVSLISSDPDGVLWIGTADGLSRYDGSAFVNYKGRDRIGRGVNGIFRDSQGVRWFGTEVGVTRFDGRVWSTLDSRDGLVANGVNDICESPRGVFWLTWCSWTFGCPKWKGRRLRNASFRSGAQAK